MVRSRAVESRVGTQVIFYICTSSIGAVLGNMLGYFHGLLLETYSTVIANMNGADWDRAET